MTIKIQNNLSFHSELVYLINDFISITGEVEGEKQLKEVIYLSNDEIVIDKINADKYFKNLELKKLFYLKTLKALQKQVLAMITNKSEMMAYD